MLSTVIAFAVITALFEALILLKFFKLSTLTKSWFPVFVHIVVAGLNLIVHWGTIVGTMTAVTAALVSFTVFPCVIWLKTFWRSYKSTPNCG